LQFHLVARPLFFEIKYCFEGIQVCNLLIFNGKKEILMVSPADTVPGLRSGMVFVIGRKDGQGYYWLPASFTFSKVNG
jgi:hypothetical protein